jgi:hypothetical protein
MSFYILDKPMLALITQMNDLFSESLFASLLSANKFHCNYCHSTAGRNSMPFHMSLIALLCPLPSLPDLFLPLTGFLKSSLLPSSKYPFSLIPLGG